MATIATSSRAWRFLFSPRPFFLVGGNGGNRGTEVAHDNVIPACLDFPLPRVAFLYRTICGGLDSQIVSVPLWPFLEFYVADVVVVCSDWLFLVLHIHVAHVVPRGVYHTLSTIFPGWPCGMTSCVLLTRYGSRPHHSLVWVGLASDHSRLGCASVRVSRWFRVRGLYRVTSVSSISNTILLPISRHS